jgi:hypothetical protein
LYGEFNRTVSGYGSSLNAGVEEIWDEYPNSDEDAVAVAPLIPARDAYRTVHTGWTSALTAAATATVVEQVNRDTTLPAKTLTNALNELKAQMIDDSESINRPTVAAAVTAWASNKGNAVVMASTTNEYGDQLDMVMAETVRLTVTADVSNGGTQFAETLTIAGQPLKPPTDYLWPGGSGASGTMAISDATATGLLTDGGFEAWTSSTVPTSWTVSVGESTVSRDSVNVVRGTYGFKITSDGSTLTTVKQQVSSALVKPNRVYCVNLWGKLSATDASGVLRVRLTNSSGTTLVDDAGASLTKSITMNGGAGFSTSFGQQYAFFSTPRQLPVSGGVWIEFAFTTSPANGVTLTLDNLGMAAATQLYPGGPFVAAFSKDTSSSLQDYYAVAVTNSLDHTSFVRSLDRHFSLRQLGIYLPTDGSPTVNDNLIS